MLWHSTQSHTVAHVEKNQWQRKNKETYRVSLRERSTKGEIVCKCRVKSVFVDLICVLLCRVVLSTNAKEDRTIWQIKRTFQAITWLTRRSISLFRHSRSVHSSVNGPIRIKQSWNTNASQAMSTIISSVLSTVFSPSFPHSLSSSLSFMSMK